MKVKNPKCTLLDILGDSFDCPPHIDLNPKTI